MNNAAGLLTNLAAQTATRAPLLALPKAAVPSKTPKGPRRPSKRPQRSDGPLTPNRTNILPPPQVAVTMTKAERDQSLTEIAQREAELPLLTIVGSAISLFSWEEMRRIAPVEVTTTQLEGLSSVNDPRMGVVSPTQPCMLCSQVDCPGHYGRIDFRVPIYNPAVIRELVSVLTCVCHGCGGLLVTEDVMRQRGFLRMGLDKRLSAMEKHCKGITSCFRRKPKVEGGDIIPCGRNPEFVTTEIKENGEITYRIPKEEGSKVSKDDPIQVMTIQGKGGVLEILNRISDEDARLLGFPEGSHPRNMIIWGILVPPPIARPPVYEGGAMLHDQLTHMFVSIVKKVHDIHNPSKKQNDPVKELYSTVRQMIFKTEGKRLGHGEYLSLVERIQGKQAIMRALLMGKRDNQCGRTVAGPDASLRFGEIRIPMAWAPVLTKHVTVTNYNIHNLTALMQTGHITHITSKRTGLRRFYNPERRYRLEVGDRVDRWLENGDRVVVNRQPTLHKSSMMAYRVVLSPKLTIGLHLSYTTPMNCDFDGDENNAWNPQDFEVEAECEIILGVKNNIMSAEQNRPNMGLVMNSILGSYLLTGEDVRVNHDLFAELLSMVTNQNELLTLSARLTKYGVHPRSGAAVFSAMLPPDFYYDNKGVKIMEGILVSGRIKKSHVGTSHRSIIQELWTKYREQRTADFFTDAPWIVGKWLIEHGFSVGLNDMITLEYDENGVQYDKNQRILKQELAKIYVQLESLGGKLDDPMEEQYRKRMINNLVNIAEGIGLRLADEAFSGDNSIGIMTDKGSGTKGGVANIGQMMGSVGQQFLRGQRLQPKLSGGRRILPVYDYDSNDPEAHGFIPESFFTGVSPTGLFFLQMAGREGLLDTALKTSETGSMQHKMIKALENIVVAYDGSIRNTIGTMFSPMYNAGYDIAEMMAVENPEKPDFSSFIDLKQVARELNAQRGWVPKSTNDLIVKKRAKLVDLPADNILPESEPVNTPAVTGPFEPYDTSVMPPVITPQLKLTKYEKARIVGTRARQIDNNAPPLVEYDTNMDPVDIAMKEYEAGVLRIYVVRKYPDGSVETVYPTLDNI